MIMPKFRRFNFIATSLLVCLFLYAAAISPKTSVAAQKHRPDTTLKVKNTELRLFVEKLARLYNVDILYGDNLVKNIFVSGDYSGLSLEETLFRVLQKTNIAFKRMNEQQFYFYNKSEVSHFDISGRALDSKSGEPLPFANVRLADLNVGATTDQQGYFALRSLPVESCTLQVSYIGYVSKQTIIEPTNLAPVVEVKLTSQPIAFDAVTLEASQRQIFHMSANSGQLTVSAKKFDDLPILGEKDILRTIELTPGISGGASGSSGITIRGSSSLDNLVLLDGMPIYNVNHSFGLLSAFSSDAIKDVRIYKGGFPARYGGRLSGVVELTTKNGNFSEPGINIGIGPMNVGVGLSVPLGGKGAFFMAGRHSYNTNLSKDMHRKLFRTEPYFPQLLYPAGFTEKQDADSTFNPVKAKETYATDISFYDLIAKTTFFTSAKDILTASVYLGADKILSDYNLQELRRQNQKNNSASAGMSAQWRRQWNTGLSSTFQLTRSEYATSYKDKKELNFASEFDDQYVSQFFAYKNKLQNLAGNLRNTAQIQTNLTINFGAELSKISTTWQQEGSFLGAKLNRVTNATSLSFYLESDWRVSQKLEARLGFRTTYFDQMDTYYHLPRLALSYHLNDNWSLKSAWGKYRQFILNFTDEFQYFGREIPWLLANGFDLKPASAEHYIFGTHWQKNGWLFDIEFYQKELAGLVEMENELIINEATVISKTFFIQSPGRFKGVDILAQKNMKNFTGWISYSHNQTNIHPKSGSSYATATDIPHKIDLVASYAQQAWALSTTWHISSGRPYSTPKIQAVDVGAEDAYFLLPPNRRNERRLPASQRLDVSVSRKFNQNHLSGKLAFSIYNLLNRDNVWYRHFDVEQGKLKALNVKLQGFTPSLSLELQFH